ncbi:hypothetical protein L4174_022360 [Photobacterium sp. CCB-ST2H9]|uniref:hypothetical protein n=1 Tax=Photobacterium sp. CCB-ST2H9 TaxID=2912855 RepID=UPI00200345C0|nr:hypothetical protein [Photobacterium sp. CCB-ST2H9]UTM59443.1 hypothetical protein L4174_022360 [Photobacterium sp. CCB-ST2H9]
MKSCTLLIPIDESSIILRSCDGLVLFQGDEFQANKFCNIIPPVAGGDTYRHVLSGVYECKNGSIIVRIQDGFDLDSMVEVVFDTSIIKRISVYWSI